MIHRGLGLGFHLPQWGLDETQAAVCRTAMLLTAVSLLILVVLAGTGYRRSRGAWLIVLDALAFAGSVFGMWANGWLRPMHWLW